VNQRLPFNPVQGWVVTAFASLLEHVG
jgi:hypothetical protein